MTTLTEQGCRRRRERLWNVVDENVEWLLIADPRHVQYLANFWVQPLSFSGGERGLLLLERDGRATILGDNFSVRSASGEPYVDREVVETWYDHEHSVRNRDHALFAALRRVASELTGRRGLVESDWLPLGAAALLDDPQPTDLGSQLRDLRRQKEPDEIALLKLCMQAGKAGQERLREVLAPGISDFDVYREVQQAAVAAAGRPALVYGDFRLTNDRNPKQGGLPVGETLSEGDLFILDYSVVLDGYRSDFTNTMVIGEPRPEVRDLFGVCESAMQQGEKVLREGVSASDVHAAVAGPFRDAGRGDAFPHHAGHGIGLAHPEPPILVPKSTETLRAGDVVTLEPGAYVEGVGGMRIEHNYLVTEDGYERLSHHTIALT